MRGRSAGADLICAGPGADVVSGGGGNDRIGGGGDLGGVAFSYRAMAAPDGSLSAAALRAGMDSMHPRTP